MSKFILTNKSVQDLSEIWNYTLETWSEDQADKYYKTLINTFQEIADKPQLGRSYSSVSQNLLGIKINKHIIFYTSYDQNTILIIRILHERMDLKSKVLE